MKSLRRLNKDRVSAGLLLILGLAISVQGASYHLGNLTHMGAGFVPVMLGVVIALVGVAIGVTAEPGDFGTAEKKPTEWRGWLCVLGGVVAFVVFGTWGGLVPATFLSVFIAALGDRQNSVRDAVLLAVGITIAGVAIFVYGLKMTFPMFSWG